VGVSRERWAAALAVVVLAGGAGAVALATDKGECDCATELRFEGRTYVPACGTLRGVQAGPLTGSGRLEVPDGPQQEVRVATTPRDGLVVAEAGAALGCDVALVPAFAGDEGRAAFDEVVEVQTG
jgi:hypothetical protein